MADSNQRSRALLYSFVALAVVLAAVFARLGFWQLDRLAERRADNARRRAALAEPPVPFTQLKGGRTYLEDRQAVVQGTPDYDNEFVLTGRSRSGSPGVHVFTPVRMAGADTAVLVNRGWVYAADAATVDRGLWREARATFHGYTRAIPPGDAPSASGRAIRTLQRAPVERLVPYPTHSLYVVSQDSATSETPARLPAPDLGEGPHLSYAIQWFCFAAIAVVGAGIVVYRSRWSASSDPSGAWPTR